MAHALYALVERAYEPAESLDVWLDVLTEAAEAAVPGCLGTAARVVQMEPVASLKMAVRVRDPRFAEALRRHDREARHRYPNIVLRGGPGLRMLAGDAPEHDEYIQALRERFAPFGSVEMGHITVSDGAGRLLTLGVFFPERPSHRSRVWSMAAVHLAAAFRLRRHFDEVVALVPDGAVLTPTGDVVDADGAARSPAARTRFRRAIRELDRARAQSSHEEALAAWRGLVDGTWSILDRHDHDGRRFIVAVPNPIGARDPRALTAREAEVASLVAEGYSDKWIAYAMGLPRTTVSTHLHDALRKLGLPSRVALARAFAGSRDTDPRSEAR